MEAVLAGFVRCGILVVIAATCGCTAGDDVPAPTIGSLVPDHGPPGATVTIMGDYFCQQPDTGDEDPLACENIGHVEFDQVPATAGTYTDTVIMSEVPSLQPGSTNVVVVVASRRSNRVDYLVDAP